MEIGNTVIKCTVHFSCHCGISKLKYTGNLFVLGKTDIFNS